MAFMAVDDGIVIGDTPRVFRRGEIATSHQSNECNWKLCVCVYFLLLVQSCQDFVPMNGELIQSWLEEPTSVHSTGQLLLEVTTTSSRGPTNSAHDTGVVCECEKGNCMKELEVQFLSSNSSDETECWLKERACSNSFLNTCQCAVEASEGKVGGCVRCCVQHRAHNMLNRAAGTHLLVAIG